ncbi:MAG: agmatine deiminase family protein [Opitutales bacterium]
MSPTRTPKQLGYRFPAEWELQEAVWFAWPVRETLWPDCLDRVRERLVELYLQAAVFQKVRILCPSYEQESLRQLMIARGETTNVEFYDYETDDVWIRDFGPLFLIHDRKKELCIADWRYNAWGNKFPEQEKDSRASAWIANQIEMRRFSFEQVLEGGAVESNGAGQILTTEVVALNPNRNGELESEKLERKFTEGLGASEILWLKDGLVGDDTDGHIDNLARFFKEDGILIAKVSDPGDVNYPALEENARRLREFQTVEGEAFTIVQLPLPDPILHRGEPLAASYLNYIVLNGAVLVPTYNQASKDEEALGIIGDCFPMREIIGVDCTDIVKEGGALHCMSQHQPMV